LITFTHPTGNQNSRSVVEALQQEQLLQEFHTSVAVFENDFYDNLSALKPFSDFRRRKFDENLKAHTKTHPYKELARMIASKVGLSKLTMHEKGRYCVDAVFQYLDRKVAKNLISCNNNLPKAIYAYEDGALSSFKAARQKNMFSLYDLPIGYWRTARKLMYAELETQPEWAITLTGFKDSEAKLKRKDEEMKLADHIFVASQFTANSLKDYPDKLPAVHVIPYGFPKPNKTKNYNFHISKRPLKLLFVGRLSQRKGISHLFKAAEALGNKVDLTLVGGKVNNKCEALDKALAKHKWIPSLSHHQVLELMRNHDVLLFPSLFEGFGLVITEAMSQGTPVITTERTAGPDLITDGMNGWLIEAGSTIALQEKIEQILSEPISVATVGKAAAERARKRPWSVYGKEVADTIRTILDTE